MPVSPEKIKQLEERLVLLGIYENDLTERFVRSQGSGGQKVNKTSSCVYLKHEPTGIEVKCQEDRSQAMNRFFARRIIADRIEELISGRKPERIEHIRKQKKRRARRSRPKPAIICKA